MLSRINWKYIFILFNFLTFLLNILYLCAIINIISEAMLLNTTYKNDEHELIIQDLVGKPFSLKKKLILRGVGSGRMVIDEASPRLEQTLLNGPDLNYANLEIRPKGILVRITRRLDNFTWIIPFYHLHIYKTSGLSVHGQGQFLHFRENQMLRNNKSFFRKVSNLKLDFMKDYYLINP